MTEQTVPYAPECARPAPRADAAGRPILLVGPWTQNKGDGLMLHAVLAHYANRRLAAPRELWAEDIPDTLDAVWLPPPAGGVGDGSGRAGFGAAAYRLAKSAVTRLPSRLVRRVSGTGTAARPAALLDCSGFAYGDAWSAKRLWERHRYYADLKRRGARIVMLPQALGPFRKPDVVQAARSLLGTCDLILARDADSLRHVRDLDPGMGVALEQCADISHCLSGVPPADPLRWRRSVALVPNMRMVDRTPPDRAAAYLDFMGDAARAAREAGLEPWIAMHETNDGKIVAALNERLAVPLRVVDEPAREMKGLFGCCHAVIASRYHALVSTLSQGVPAIGTSWSHKYDRLFEEYGQDACLLAPEGDPSERRGRLAEVLSDEGRDALAARIMPVAVAKAAEVEAMWRRVDAFLGAERTGTSGR